MNGETSIDFDDPFWFVQSVWTGAIPWLPLAVGEWEQHMLVTIAETFRGANEWDPRPSKRLVQRKRFPAALVNKLDLPLLWGKEAKVAPSDCSLLTVLVQYIDYSTYTADTAVPQCIHSPGVLRFALWRKSFC